MADPGQSAIEVGRKRIRSSEESPSHFSRWIVLSIANEVAGAFIAHQLTGPHEAKDLQDLPVVYAPMLELEKEAVGSWYIMTLAVFPEFRNKGLGTTMLQHAEKLAKDAGYNQLSIIVLSDNTSALRLYERFGFNESARKPFIPFPPSQDTGEWVLLKKQI